MFSPSSTRENSDFIHKVSAHLPSTTMTSADFSNLFPSLRPPSVRSISLYLFLPHLLVRYFLYLHRGWDFGSMWYLIRSNSLCMWFLFVSTDTAVWLTSVPESPLTTLPLAWLRETTPALTGLSPFGMLNALSYINHSRHTQRL